MNRLDAHGPAATATAAAACADAAPTTHAADAIAAATTITLQLDGRPHTLPAGSTLAALVASLGRVPSGVGTAVNGLFVARGQREACVLRDGDAVLFFQAIVGG